MKKKPHKKAAGPQQKKTSSYRELTLALLSGLLCVASFPRLELFPLAWVALIPLFFALANATPRQAFLRGWLFGMVHTIGICYWVFYAMHANSNAGFMVSLFFLVV
ncbi:MAG: hypothetical protein GY868_16425, partial [Deltaproteobacteria bacterium]|nr:hypothetical protein [Deltaproteobacteria bacterium]